MNTPSPAAAPRRFPSAVDGWLLGLIALSCAAVLAAVLLTLGAAMSWAFLLAMALAALGLLLPLWILLSTHYTVQGDALSIRSGPLHWRIPLADIQAVRPTRSPLASPALSLDRLELRRRRGPAILVSPRDREGFLEAIGHGGGHASGG